MNENKRCDYCGHTLTEHTRSEYQHTLDAVTRRCGKGCVCANFIYKGHLHTEPQEDK